MISILRKVGKLTNMSKKKLGDNDLALSEIINPEMPDESDQSRLRFKTAWDNLKNATLAVKSMYQPDLFQTSAAFMDSDDGIDYLMSYANDFDRVGVFHNTPWQKLGNLQPELVGYGLKGEGANSLIEFLSELRILAITQKKYENNEFSTENAHTFLKKVLCLNLDLLYLENTEESRSRPNVYHRANRLLCYISEHVYLDGLQDEVIKEIEEIITQRPILNHRVKKLIRYATKLPSGNHRNEYTKRLEVYSGALSEPSPLSKKFQDIIKYREALDSLDDISLNAEIDAFNYTFSTTGFGNPYHAVLLRFLARNMVEKVPLALDLDVIGNAEYEKYQEKICTIIKICIFPNNLDGIFGLSRVMRRGLFSQKDVSAGLMRMIDLDISPESKKQLLRFEAFDSGISANAILISGTLAILGHPLGVGQGPNPTCQSARGLSLWGQHAPGYLVSLISTAAKDNVVEFDFESGSIRSDQLQEGITGGDFDTDKLDPVSRLLVPHLDKIYNEMMLKASFRAEDPHKWVNPAFYGKFVYRGFSSCIDILTATIQDYKGFLRHFYATHHPVYNGGLSLVYPNPVGLFVTDINGNLLGFHAVSLQRIQQDENKNYRAYFYNPNNESRQNWGAGVTCSVSGNGEKTGETSLPFDEFLSRLYAYHFNPYDEGDAYAVPEKIINDIYDMAKESWGTSYKWL
tara:strand:- start:7297 stop:9360 length:2064 start_codon:yes stop_codon:yes gene_type:complete